MCRKRTVNMNIHHKNMKQVSEDMKQWTQENLSSLGIYECSYNHFDIKRNIFMPIPMHYEWYCEYLEKGYDLSVAERLNEGANYWKEDDPMFTAYKKCVGRDDCYKLDLVIKNESGFELLIVAGSSPLTAKGFNVLQKNFYQLSFQGHKIRKLKPNTMLEIDPIKSVTEKFYNSGNDDSANLLDPSSYKKARFQEVILTAKEQLYIEYLIYNFTHKQIASKQGCSETAVRKVITNIKIKLGNAHMSASTMLLKLNDIGALAVCSGSIIKM